MQIAISHNPQKNVNVTIRENIIDIGSLLLITDKEADFSYLCTIAKVNKNQVGLIVLLCGGNGMWDYSGSPFTFDFISEEEFSKLSTVELLERFGVYLDEYKVQIVNSITFNVEIVVNEEITR